MGSGSSQPNLEALTAEALGDLAASLGADYVGYKAAFVEHSVTGSVVSNLDDAGLATKLADLGVTDAVHVDALMGAIKRLKPILLAEFNGMKDNQYFKVIHSAIRWQKPNIADLLTHPGTVDCLDEQTGNVPIHIAAQNGYTDVVRLLIEKQANVNAKNKKGNTALHMAMAYDYFESVDLLLAAGADPTIANEGGFTADTGLEGDKSFTFKVRGWWPLRRLVSRLNNRSRHPISCVNDVRPLNLYVFRPNYHHVSTSLSPFFGPIVTAFRSRSHRMSTSMQALMTATDEATLFAAFDACAALKVLSISLCLYTHSDSRISWRVHAVACRTLFPLRLFLWQDVLAKSAFVAMCLKRKKELGAAWPERYFLVLKNASLSSHNHMRLEFRTISPTAPVPCMMCSAKARMTEVMGMLKAN